MNPKVNSMQELYGMNQAIANLSPAAIILLRAASAELFRQGIDKPNFTVEKVLAVIQGDSSLSLMNGRLELFEFLSPVSDTQLRQILSQLFP
jgi:hypothetical protein